jgi:predicted glycosyltransferase
VPTTGQKAMGRGERIALYSHDALGLGHMRRNLAIAEALSRTGSHPVLLIAGAREATAFPMPPGVDCVALPALRKRSNGRYAPRSLDLPLENLIGLRSRTIRAALDSFAPEALIVDKVPLGLGSELEPSLKALKAGGRARLVLGLRDVLDVPATARREWRLAGSDAVVRDLYDAVWIYGDPRVYDPVAEYRFSHRVAVKTRYTGYLDRHASKRVARLTTTQPQHTLAPPPGRLWLCLVGGGEDGYRLAEAFARVALPKDVSGAIVAGPFMSGREVRRLRRLAEDRTRLHLLEFVEEPGGLIRPAERVVAMAGYNTICELLSFGKRALVVPRTRTRREQLIRAERMRDLGLLELLHPDRLSAAALTKWLADGSAAARPAATRIDMGGLDRIPDLLDEVLRRGRGPHRRPEWRHMASRARSRRKREAATGVGKM